MIVSSCHGVLVLGEEFASQTTRRSGCTAPLVHHLQSSCWREAPGVIVIMIVTLIAVRFARVIFASYAIWSERHSPSYFSGEGISLHALCRHSATGWLQQHVRFEFATCQESRCNAGSSAGACLPQQKAGQRPPAPAPPYPCPCPSALPPFCRPARSVP